MSKLYLITGPAGVGKSAVSKIIAENLNKSAHIEGDEIYHFIKGGYVSPWLSGNHLDIFWKNSICIISNFLRDGYDVVFNYTINKRKQEELKNVFNDADIKFVVLIADEETIIKRDKERPLDCQMGERSIVLLNKFKNENFESKYILDTSKLSVEETVNLIEKEERFKL